MGGTYELGLPTSVTVLFPAAAASSAHTAPEPVPGGDRWFARAGVTSTGMLSGAIAAPITVTSVTTGKTYTCAVTATNARGTSPSSCNLCR